MARIQCPGCGKIDDVDLQGHFLATCDDCNQKFVVYIVGQRIMQRIDLTCPQCGTTQESVQIGLGGVKVTCNSCGHDFQVSSEP